MNEEKQKKDYYERLDDYLDNKFFSEDDRKISFLVGKYYNYMATLEKSILRTTSLYTKLPAYTKRMDRDQLLKVLEKSNNVATRLISKKKDTTSTGSKYREKINKLLSGDIWRSSHVELSLAFMMGFSYYVPSEDVKKGELK